MNQFKNQTLKTIAIIFLYALSNLVAQKAQAQVNMYLDYNVANYDDTYYVWPYNSLYNSNDTANNFIGLALDTLGGFSDPSDPAGSWTYWGNYFPTPYPSNLNMFIDSITIFATHENNSGNTDIFRMKIVQLNANGTLSSNVLWQDEQYSNAGLSTNNQWLGAGSQIALEFAPNFSVPIGTKVGVVFEYDDPSKLDTLGVIAGCFTDGTLQAEQSTWKNSFMRLPPFINNITKNSSVGYGNPAGSNGWYFAQNWSFTIKTTLTSSVPPPNANFNLNASTICVGSCITPSNSTTGSASSYIWSFPGGNPSSSTSQNPGSVCYNAPGTYSISLIAQNSGGSDTHSQVITVDSPQFSVNITSDADSVGSSITICNGDMVTFNATTYPISNAIFQWKKNGVNIGTNSSTLMVSNLQASDVITCTASSSNSCSISSNPINVGTVNPTNFAPDFTASQTNFTNPLFNVTFTNNTPNPGNYAFMWYYGDGTSSNAFSPTHTYPTNGSFSVALEAQSGTTGCKASTVKTNYITCAGSTQNCSQTVTVSPSGSISACQGGNVLLNGVAVSASNPTYQWFKNGVTIGGATQNTYNANSSGSYSLMVYENGTCPVSSTPVNLSFSNPTPAPPVIIQSGQLLPCGLGAVTLSANVSGGPTLSWNTGAINSNLTVNQPGNYTVVATYGPGCQSSASSLVIPLSLVQNPGICMATVDTIINKNKIIWEPQFTTDIDSFYIYKNDNQSSIYNKIGAADYLSLSEFIDVNSNPQTQSSQYKIAALDNCGGLTMLSNYHKTVHLQVFPGVSTNRQLSWNKYDGVNFINYQIWRKLPGQQFQILSTLPSASTSFTDVNPPSIAASYRVDVVLLQACNSVDRNTHVKSYSNINLNLALYTQPDGLEDTENLLANLNLLPNPSDGNAVLQWESLKLQNLQIVVTDVVGKIVLLDKLTAQKGVNNYNITVDAAGVYFLSIYNEQGAKNVLKMVVR